MEKTITPILLSYNLPKETEGIYDKLVNDGFNNIIVVDNGSKKKRPAACANLLLPKNIRFTGQARMALIYCMDYFPTDYYWIITTSAELFDDINYMDVINEAFKDLKEMKIGIIAPVLVGGTSNDLPVQRYSGNEEKIYSTHDPITLQLVAAIISHELLSICRKGSSSYFNQELKRGHGTEIELCYHAIKNNYWPIVCYKFKVKWNTNLTYTKGIDTETRDEYHRIAT